MTGSDLESSDAVISEGQRWVLQSMGVTLWKSKVDAPVVQKPVQPDTARPPDPVAEPVVELVTETEEALAFVDAAPESAERGDVPAMDWAALRSAVAQCTRCPLHQTRTQGVFGVGSEDANWMIIGEAPGAEEDRRGEPFVGRAGQLLDAMLRSVELDRSRVFIANILKSRPLDNRDPHPDETAACAPYLKRQIELVRPSLILAVGRVAAQHLLASEDAVGRLRGKVHAYGHEAIPLVVTYHPAYLLRQPSAKGKVWQDLKLARRTEAASLK
jgi:uracil-DNA glycosylase